MLTFTRINTQGTFGVCTEQYETPQEFAADGPYQARIAAVLDHAKSATITISSARAGYVDIITLTP